MNRLTLLLVFSVFSVPLPADEMNLATCLTGQWPDLCNHKILSDEETERVRRAEYSVNLDKCKKDFSSQNCNRKLLSNLDEQKIRKANTPSERRIISSSNGSKQSGNLAKGEVVVIHHKDSVLANLERLGIPGTMYGRDPSLFPMPTMNSSTGQTIRQFRRGEVPDNYDGDYVIVDQNHSHPAKRQNNDGYNANRNSNYYATPSRRRGSFSSNYSMRSEDPDPYYDDYYYGYNRLYQHDQEEVYESSFGTRYEYDLSKPLDQIRYEVDPSAQLRDEMDINPIRELERDLGQHGGGVLDDQ